MRRICLSTVALFLGAAVGGFLASYLARTTTRLISAQALPRATGEEESNVTEPIVLLPKAPPTQFFIDSLEPIVVRPEADEYDSPPTDVRFDEPPLPTPTAVRTRMPLADELSLEEALARAIEEESTDQESTDSEPSLWSSLVDMVKALLADASAPAGEPVAAPANEPTQPESANPETTPDATAETPLQMPIIPYDHHHHYPGCPGLGGCPRPYTPFPLPAHRFERTTPATDQPSHMTPIRVHGGVGP